MTAQVKKKQGQKSEYPKRVSCGVASVTIYEVASKSNASGKAYKISWSSPTGRRLREFADPAEALSEARLLVAKLAQGEVEAAEMKRSDREEWLAAVKLAKTHGRPLLTALQEWAKAFETTSGHVLAAADEWAKKHSRQSKRILAADCVEAFIKAKEKDGEGERTYRSKLNPIKTYFSGRYLDDISTEDWTDYLFQWEDLVTRNDIRKRAVTMCRWAREIGGYLPRDVTTEIERTARAKAGPTDIGIITPATFRSALAWMHQNHPQYLAPLAIAGFAGVRSDEIHGKREDRDLLKDDPHHDVRRQSWDDINLTDKLLHVTNAKKNTPSWRYVPMCDALVDWLKLCPGNHKGYVCEPGVMDSKVRKLLREAGFELPENCFRHSYITYKVAETDNKAQVAHWAGNSEQIIDQRYRRPETKANAKAWFDSAPGVK